MSMVIPEELTEPFVNLLELAKKVRENAYAPYSNYKVGVAIEDINGQIFVGCNVENANYGNTICAERHALGAAIAHGSRTYKAIGIVSGPANNNNCNPGPPCGTCLQSLRELMDGNTLVIVANPNLNNVQFFKLQDLLPVHYSFIHLDKLSS